MQEARLRLAPFLAAHAAVDQHHGLRAAEQRADLALEITQRVAMLGEEHQLLARRRDWLRNRARAVGHGGLTNLAARAHRILCQMIR